MPEPRSERSRVFRFFHGENTYARMPDFLHQSELVNTECTYPLWQFISSGGRSTSPQDLCEVANESFKAVQSGLNKVNVQEHRVEARSEITCVLSLLGEEKVDFDESLEEIGNYLAERSASRIICFPSKLLQRYFKATISVYALMRSLLIQEIAGMVQAPTNRLNIEDKSEYTRLAASAAFCDQSIATILYGTRKGIPQLTRKEVQKCFWENPSAAFEMIFKTNCSDLLRAMVDGTDITLKTWRTFQKRKALKELALCLDRFDTNLVEEINRQKENSSSALTIIPTWNPQAQVNDLVKSIVHRYVQDVLMSMFTEEQRVGLTLEDFVFRGQETVDKFKALGIQVNVVQKIDTIELCKVMFGLKSKAKDALIYSKRFYVQMFQRAVEVTGNQDALLRDIRTYMMTLCGTPRSQKPGGLMVIRHEAARFAGHGQRQLIAVKWVDQMSLTVLYESTMAPTKSEKQVAASRWSEEYHGLIDTKREELGPKRCEWSLFITSIAIGLFFATNPSTHALQTPNDRQLSNMLTYDDGAFLGIYSKNAIKNRIKNLSKKGKERWFYDVYLSVSQSGEFDLMRDWVNNTETVRAVRQRDPDWEFPAWCRREVEEADRHEYLKKILLQHHHLKLNFHPGRHHLITDQPITAPFDNAFCLIDSKRATDGSDEESFAESNHPPKVTAPHHLFSLHSS